MGLLCNYSVWFLSICTYIPFIPVISRPSTLFQFSLKNTEKLFDKSSAWEICVLLLGQLESNFVTSRCAEGINRSLKQHVMFLKKCSKPCFSQQFRYQCIGFLLYRFLIYKSFIHRFASCCSLSRISLGPHHFFTSVRFSHDLLFHLCEANSIKNFYIFL